MYVIKLNTNLFNKATKGVYELGSTLKLITAAIAFESNLINENEVFDVSKPLRVSSRIISDFHPLSYSINIPEVIVHSSNIGSAKIAEKFGPSIQLKYLKSLSNQITIIIISHDKEAFDLCDEIYEIDSGKILLSKSIFKERLDKT